MLLKIFKSFNYSFFPMLVLSTYFVLAYSAILILKGYPTIELLRLDLSMVLFSLVSGVLIFKTKKTYQPKGILLLIYFIIVILLKLAFFFALTISLLLSFDKSKYSLVYHIQNLFGLRVIPGEDYLFISGVILLMVIGLLFLVKIKIKNKLFTFITEQKYLFLTSIVILILSLVFQGIFVFFKTAIPLVKPIILNPLASYDWKMNFQIGYFYDYTLFVNQNTPPDAVFLEPPMKMPWPLIGNKGYTRYFIFPRELVSVDVDEADKGKITHIFIIGRKEGQWPTTKIKAKRLLYMPDDGSDKPIIIEKDYDPQDQINDLWGIIEL